VSTEIAIENPYWNEVRSLFANKVHISNEEYYQWIIKHAETREKCCRTYAFAIADPASVAFVARHCGPASSRSARALDTGPGNSHNTASISWHTTLHRRTKYPMISLLQALKIHLRRWSKHGIQCSKEVPKFSLSTPIEHYFYVGRHTPATSRINVSVHTKDVALSSSGRAMVAAQVTTISSNFSKSNGNASQNTKSCNGSTYTTKSEYTKGTTND